MKTPTQDIADLSEFQEDNCKKFVDRIIKTNREVFMMSSLIEKQMCGYDIIKEIFSKCDVFLSQGTVYPVLYTLEGEGLLHAEYSKGDMRSKNYSLTLKGRKIAENDIDDFSRALEQVSLLLKR
jgi:PadR family transcriptional regulator, regulatory protein PadR